MANIDFQFLSNTHVTTTAISYNQKASNRRAPERPVCMILTFKTNWRGSDA